MKDDGPTDRETIGRPVTRLERGAIVAVAAIATARRCASNRNPVRPCEWLPRSADTRHSLKACDGTSSWRAAVACHRRTAAGRPSSSSIHGHLSATPPALEAVRARLPFAACGQLLVSHQHRFRSVSLRLLCRHGFTLSDCRSLRPGYFPVAPTGLLPGRSDRPPLNWNPRCLRSGCSTASRFVLVSLLTSSAGSVRTNTCWSGSAPPSLPSVRPCSGGSRTASTRRLPAQQRIAEPRPAKDAVHDCNLALGARTRKPFD